LPRPARRAGPTSATGDKAITPKPRGRGTGAWWIQAVGNGVVADLDGSQLPDGHGCLVWSSARSTAPALGDRGRLANTQGARAASLRVCGWEAVAACLAGATLRRERLHIAPLDPAAREAARLITSVMRDRGYPIDGFEQRAADISVDHPQVVDDDRAAHAGAEANDRAEASTEDLRQALVHYRSLLEWSRSTRPTRPTTPKMPVTSTVRGPVKDRRFRTEEAR
jgi:hypothetical protein